MSTWSQSRIRYDRGQPRAPPIGLSIMVNPKAAQALWLEVQHSTLRSSERYCPPPPSRKSEHMADLRVAVEIAGSMA